MLYPFTGALHIVTAGFVFVVIGYSLLARRRSSEYLIKHWFSWFFLFLLYLTFLALPSLLGNVFSEINKMAGFLFIAGIFALGLGAWNGFVMGLSFLYINPKIRTFYSMAYLIVLGFILLLFGVFFENPRIGEDGNWIFWHSNLSLTLAYSSLMTIAAWTFAYSFFKGLPQLQDWKIRFSSVCMGIGSIILPLAAFFYFAGKSTTHLATAFIIVFTGLSFFLLGSIVARHSRVP